MLIRDASASAHTRGIRPKLLSTVPLESASGLSITGVSVLSGQAPSPTRGTAGATDRQHRSRSSRRTSPALEANDRGVLFVRVPRENEMAQSSSDPDFRTVEFPTDVRVIWVIDLHILCPAEAKGSK